VRAAAKGQGWWADAPAMADSSNLETRVRAMLNRGLDRRPLTRTAALAVAVAALLVFAPLAVLQLHAQASGGAIAGTVMDPSGGVVPNCRVTVRSLGDPKFEVTATTDPAGIYRLTSLPPGEYAVEFGARGFSLLKTRAVLVAGAAARLDGNLEVGSITENVTVQGTRNTPAPAARTPQRIRVGGNVQPSKLIAQTRPEYPAELQQAGVEGTVIIRSIVSTSGTLLNPQVVNTVDARLAKLAIDAVSQWTYQPSLLNGQPVEALTTISVDFRLAQ